MYDAFGVGTSTSAPADPWGYGGQYGYYTDNETGLALLTYRYYDPGLGRFLTRDPIGYNGGVNLYEYTLNNPVERYDPLGLIGCTDEGASGPEGEGCTDNGTTESGGVDGGGENYGSGAGTPVSPPEGGGGGGEGMGTGGNGMGAGGVPGGGGILGSGGSAGVPGSVPSNPPGTPVPTPGHVVTPGGTAVSIPPGYAGSVANNGNGLVFQAPNSPGNANQIRIADPNNRYPNGYARVYNCYGQPINPATGNPDTQGKTHIPL